MPRANLTPAVVIAAAADLADRAGFASVTLTALARQLDVQTASLYAHVRDRAAVLDGVHELALVELADAIAAAVAGRSGRDALVGLAEAHRSFARTTPGRWAALQRPAAESTVRSDGAVRVATLTVAVLRGYPLPTAEIVHATRLVAATINGFLSLEQAGGFGHRAPAPSTSWQRALDALDSLLTSWPTR